MIGGLRQQAGPWALMDELLGLQEDFNRLFDEGPRRYTGGRRRYPLVNVWESPDGLVVDAELPGVDPNAVDIAVENGLLTIAGKRELAEGQPEQYHRRERPEGAFSRSFELPFRVEAEAVKAAYQNGILRVTLPRAESDKPKRIAVKVG